MLLRRKAALGAGVVLLAVAIAYSALHEYVRAAAFVIQAAGLDGMAGKAAALQTRAFTERDLRIPWRGGELRARWFSPGRSHHPPILLVPGVHAAGLDEPRLITLARDLAAIGHPVVTTELSDLMRYEISTRNTDMIEDAALWVSNQGELAPSGRLGVMGISFAGGLGLVAAGRPSIAARVEFVMSFGGHGDLPRTLRYLCTGQLADGTHRPPHDYGVAIILLGVAGRVVPAGQVAPLQRAIRTFLEASRLDMFDKARSQAEFGRAREMAEQLDEPARTLMRSVNDRDVARLGPLLLPHVSVFGGDPALSPSRSPAPMAPVYLLHGQDDNVIPALESALLARDLDERGVRVRLLATPLITHAEVDRAPSMRDIWRMVGFWGDLLNQ
jgi:dienelactone hydrolase